MLVEQDNLPTTPLRPASWSHSLSSQKGQRVLGLERRKTRSL